MLALIKGTGRLPEIIEERLAPSGEPAIICPAVDGIAGDLPVTLGTLGTVLNTLKDKGVSQICLAGAIERASLGMEKPDAATAPLAPRLMAALGQGDGGAITGLLDLLQGEGFEIRAAHEICPDLLPGPGVLTATVPDAEAEADAIRGMRVLAITGPADIGQGCVVEDRQVLAVEALPGTNAMLKSVAAFRKGLGRSPGGVFCKAPKPGQDVRADLPTVGPETARYVIAAGLSGMVVEAGGVLVLDRDELTAKLDAAGAFLWVRAV